MYAGNQKFKILERCKVKCMLSFSSKQGDLVFKWFKVTVYFASVIDNKHTTETSAY